MSVVRDETSASLWRDNPLRDPSDLRLSHVAGPCGVVVFGVSGDLSRHKLLPAFYDLANRGLLPPGFSLVGFGRRAWTDDDFRDMARDTVQRHARTAFRETVWEQLASGFRFVQGQFDEDDAFDRLSDMLGELDHLRGTGGNFAFYLAVPPASFPEVVQQLRKHGLTDPGGGAWRRAVIEKPFGHDLSSARRLNRLVQDAFSADEIFRIDHYLGKETVQNILAVRFANVLFEPLWNRAYLDQVQITMAEDIGVGTRAGYYDTVGAARDVLQNHLLQLLTLTAMEEPASFDAGALETEKLKVLQAVSLPHDLAAYTVQGQYDCGWQGGQFVPGYREEPGVNPSSRTDTYAAVKLEISNRRWAGVPFYLRTGKRLARRATEIAAVFQPAPYLPFAPTATRALGQNALIMRVQPDEGVTVRFGSKVPGTAMQIRDVTMDFTYGESFTESSPEAYERLLLDVLLGEPPLFPREREVELSWQILDPIEDHWQQQAGPVTYQAGTWGPAEANQMLALDGRSWHQP